MISIIAHRKEFTKNSPTQDRTGVPGFKVLCTNHCTIRLGMHGTGFEPVRIAPLTLEVNALTTRPSMRLCIEWSLGTTAIHAGFVGFPTI